MEKGYEALHSHPSLAVFREGNLYRNSRQKDANDAVCNWQHLPEIWDRIDTQKG